MQIERFLRRCVPSFAHSKKSRDGYVRKFIAAVLIGALPSATVAPGGIRISAVANSKSRTAGEPAQLPLLLSSDNRRLEKSVGGLTTLYAITSDVTSVNPQGLPLVGYEQYTGFGTHDNYRVWVLGLQREAQYRSYQANSRTQVEISYYVRDGHGSVRALTDPNGNLTDTYDYDAFGNLISSATYCPASGIAASNAAPCTAGSSPAPTPNEFLFAGEQYDAETGRYYNRARYLNTTTGRFMTMDTVDGDPDSPLSLHKYLYTEDDPVDHIDPTGKFLTGFGPAVENAIQPQYDATHPGDIFIFGTATGLGDNPRLTPDIFNFTQRRWMEIKPLSISGIAAAETANYFYRANFDPIGYSPDTSWVPPKQPLTVWGIEIGVFNLQGILFYTDAIQNLEELAALKTIQDLYTYLPRLVSKISEPGQVNDLARLATQADESFSEVDLAGGELEAVF